MKREVFGVRTFFVTAETPWAEVGGDQRVGGVLLRGNLRVAPHKVFPALQAALKAAGLATKCEEKSEGRDGEEAHGPLLSLLPPAQRRSPSSTAQSFPTRCSLNSWSFNPTRPVMSASPEL